MCPQPNFTQDLQSKPNCQTRDEEMKLFVAPELIKITRPILSLWERVSGFSIELGCGCALNFLNSVGNEGCGISHKNYNHIWQLFGGKHD